MKQPKKLTRAQKEIVRNNSLSPNQWSLVEEKETLLILQDKRTGQIKSISKYKKKPI